MNTSLPPCPFIAGSMITDSKFFVGRREELDFITSRMTAAQPTSINVLGEWRIGKSSLLYHFCQTYEQRVQRYGKSPSDYVAIYLSLQDAQCRQEANFYRAIAKALLKRASVQNNPALSVPLNGGSLDRQTFSAAMDVWKIEKVLPVLCLDKFEELFENAEEFNNQFYDNLRSLMDRNALMLVIASYKRLDVYSRQHRLTSSFFNLGNILPLKGLTEMEATDLVRLPETKVPGTQAALSENRQKLALEWGGRHPYLLQLAGRCLWDAKQRDETVDWAKKQFQQEKQRLPQRRFNPRRLILPLRLLLWLPLNLGRLARMIGNFVDDTGNLITGAFILIAIILVWFGALNWSELQKLLKDALSG
ncbi:MAG: ATP-binding protein [Symploca sp. SIO3C6]|uniref:ATP-binding protein n=1 Tax=Symploca sp. SIO1C4 TaxID=2607765 RepID=A0A6B3NFI5_9CYAN|nr:ATP-binding protein [Symploca sp. SIO3C6]NER30427.1 ATP-binding protein [Symploca sp. SIO1C4]